MSDEIPQWALERATELVYRECGAVYYNETSAVHFYSGRALARYIAQHEERPVDPLLKEAREIAGKYYAEEGCPSAADKCRSGEWDHMPFVEVTVEGVRRGIELGKAGAA